MSRVLIPFPDMHAMASDLAPRIQARLAPLGWRRFPDGESLVTLDPGLADADVVLLAGLRSPDAIALALRFAAETAREFGARSIGLVAPYLPYMRQDARFHAGEAVSAPIFARFLQQSVDWLVTVDPHLHRNPRLEGLFSMPTRHVAAAPAMAAWLRANVPDAILIGPDSESAQWVGDIAARAQVPYQVLAKVREGDRAVRVSLPDLTAARGHTRRHRVVGTHDDRDAEAPGGSRPASSNLLGHPRRVFGRRVRAPDRGWRRAHRQYRHHSPSGVQRHPDGTSVRGSL